MGGIEIRSFKGFSLMGSHSVALISFARCSIPHVFNLCLPNQLIFDKDVQKISQFPNLLCQFQQTNLDAI
jgi:hypothetical protein